MVKHPRIREIQLGKSIKDFVQEFMEDRETILYTEELEVIAKEIVRRNEPVLRFGARCWSAEECHIEPLNSPLDGFPMLRYDPQSEDVLAECELLNEMVVELFGPHEIKGRKVTKKQVLIGDGKVCPKCGTKHMVPLILDDVTWQNRKTIGCKFCGHVWDMLYKTTAVGFE